MRFTAYCDSVAQNMVDLAELEPEIEAAAQMMIQALTTGNKILFCGNGGSAADSQHLAAELLGRYLRDRPAMPAIALTVDTSALTAIANDLGYEAVFRRQIEGLGKPGDLLVALSTSGNSPNVLRALEAAAQGGLVTLGLTGRDGGAMVEACDLCLRVPAGATSHIQEMHIVIGHFLCGKIEQHFS